MCMTQIISAQNSQLKHLAKLLSQAKTRREHRQTVLEGVHLLQSYLQAGFAPVHVFVPESKLMRAEEQSVISVLPDSLITVVGGEALAKISSLTEGEELMTLIDMPSEKKLPESGDCVVLDRVQDPGNVGTILRSAAASGVQHIVLGADSADVWAPKVLRAGMGAHFLLEITTRVDLPQWCRHYSGNIWATALSKINNRNLYSLDLKRPCAWVFGNEGSGVSAEIMQLASSCVLIPMAGQTESLNVAMASTVCLFEQLRQRLAERPSEIKK